VKHGWTNNSLFSTIFYQFAALPLEIMLSAFCSTQWATTTENGYRAVHNGTCKNDLVFQRSKENLKERHFTSLPD